MNDSLAIFVKASRYILQKADIGESQALPVSMRISIMTTLHVRNLFCIIKCLYQTVKCVQAIISSQGIVESDSFQSDHLYVCKCANERTKE